MDEEFYKLCQERSDYLKEQYDYNRREIYINYEREFTILEGFFDFCIELGRNLDVCIPQPEKPFLQFALLRIHEKSLKIARETKILMENGSASGAIARWRTLFEFSVVAKVLLKYPDLARKYIDFAAIDNYKCSKRLMEYQERLNLFRYNLDSFSEIESEYESIKKKYGWKGKDYEWAKTEDIKKPDLFNLAKAVGLEHFYAYVDESHKYNHPCMRYLLNDRGSKAPNDNLNSYLFSPFGIELPVQLTAISLAHVNHAVIAGYAQLPVTDGDKMNFYLQKNDAFPKSIISLVSERYQKQEETANAD